METTDLELISRASYDNAKVITAGSAFPDTGDFVKGFFIIPLSNSGIVVATTYGGTLISNALPVMQYPIKMRNLKSTTAVDVLVMW